MPRFALALALLCLVAAPALAAETRAPSPKQQAQQEKMRQCSATAKERSLRGDPRKAFMKECLAGHPAG